MMIKGGCRGGRKYYCPCILVARVVNNFGQDVKVESFGIMLRLFPLYQVAGLELALKD
jgi:hypothetical protein